MSGAPPIGICLSFRKCVVAIRSGFAFGGNFPYLMGR